MEKHLTLEEVKKRQVDMLFAFDEFCRKNDITYFVAYGTLLGAVRHKGYIPWDDDVDVMVPFSEIAKIKKIFKHDKYTISHYDNDPYYNYPYPRLTDNATYTKIGKRAKTYGVFVDIYPIYDFPNSESEIEKYRNRINRVFKIHLFFLRTRNYLYRKIGQFYFPFMKLLCKQYDKALYSAESDDAVCAHAFYPERVPLNKSLFEDKVEVEFEGHKLYAPIGWHECLQNWYGDYMQLPPEDKRHPYHGAGNYYSK